MSQQLQISEDKLAQSKKNQSKLSEWNEQARTEPRTIRTFLQEAQDEAELDSEIRHKKTLQRTYTIRRPVGNAAWRGACNLERLQEEIPKCCNKNLRGLTPKMYKRLPQPMAAGHQNPGLMGGGWNKLTTFSKKRGPQASSWTASCASSQCCSCWSNASKYTSGVETRSTWSRRKKNCGLAAKLRSRILRVTRKQCCTGWCAHDEKVVHVPDGLVPLVAAMHKEWSQESSLGLRSTNFISRDHRSHMSQHQLHRLEESQQQQAEWRQAHTNRRLEKTAGIGLHHTTRRTGPKRRPVGFEGRRWSRRQRVC